MNHGYSAGHSKHFFTSPGYPRLLCPLHALHTGSHGWHLKYESFLPLKLSSISFPLAEYLSAHSSWQV